MKLRTASRFALIDVPGYFGNCLFVCRPYFPVMPQRNLEQRPPIESILSGPELRRWYWLKDELVSRARELGLPVSGGKFLVLDRIAHFLDTGEKTLQVRKTSAPKSKFDWHSEPLTTETIITDSYKNTQNVRRFFKRHIGEKFSFNIEFMAWMRSNAGRSLGEAIVEYEAMRERERKPGFKSKIAKHNQFNQYTRDFLADNPELGMKDVRKFWALKRALPSDSGRHIYERSDLELK